MLIDSLKINWFSVVKVKSYFKLITGEEVLKLNQEYKVNVFNRC